MRLAVLAVAAALAVLPLAASAEVPADIYAAQVQIGRVVEVPKTTKLWAPLQKPVPADVMFTRDIAYGSDALEKLDVATAGAGNRPVLVFVHGGGFTAGDKHRAGEYAFDNIMAWAVTHGLVGVNINYRLAPKNNYPDASNDVSSALKWVKANIKQYGGDPTRVFLWGHSAGASLVGIYVAHPEFHVAPGSGLAGAIMTSGGYVQTKGSDYFGQDAAEAAKASSLPGLLKTNVPLFVSHAELDPPGIADAGEELNKQLCNQKKCPTFVVMKGHNHMSQVFSVNTTEEQLTGPLLVFIQAHSK